MLTFFSRGQRGRQVFSGLVLLLLTVTISNLLVPETNANTISRKDGIHWVTWSDDIFERSKKDHKLVILDLEAIWCHWCHVMDETTYTNPKVQTFIAKHFIAVRVDQDSRPDLSSRYEDFGWPATIIFAPDGLEIAKRAGYIPPEAMINMLEAFVEDPTPGPSITKSETLEIPNSPLLAPAIRAEQERLFNEVYDQKQGSWGFNHKFLNWDATELAIRKAAHGEKAAEDKAKQTLSAQTNLIDPVWGGVYQYSTGGVWTEKHFEKIMQFQIENLKIYSLAFAQWKDLTYKHNLEDIARFLTTFLLHPEGGFYTSQDADLVQGKHSEDYFKLDDQGRRQLGMPAIDKNLYARENGWAVQALAAAYAATSENAYLIYAQNAANWAIKNRSLKAGGFYHGDKSPQDRYLGDTLAMGQGFLSLYGVTGDREWLKRAQAAAGFIEKNFRATTKGMAGYVSSPVSLAGKFTPQPNQEENVSLARFANLLSHYTGSVEQKEMSKYAMRFLASPQLSSRFSPGTLLADSELAEIPVHITVVGKKSDAGAKALFLAAIAYPSPYKRIEWFDAGEGPMPNNTVEYPKLAGAAAFACSANRCSLPARTPAQISERVAQIMK